MASARCYDTLLKISKDPVLSNPAHFFVFHKLAVRVGNLLERLMQFTPASRGRELHYEPELRLVRIRLQRAILTSANETVKRADELFWSEGKSESLDLEMNSGKKDELSARDRARILAEELIALRFVIYISYVVDQMHKLAWFLAMSFVVLVVAMSVYPFQSPRLIQLGSITFFAILATGVVIVLAQMDRDVILSKLTATTPNEIGKNFYIRVASFGILPVTTLLSTNFPWVRSLLFSWVQPALQALTGNG
jgi:hypothetical protein